VNPNVEPVPTHRFRMKALRMVLPVDHPRSGVPERAFPGVEWFGGGRGGRHREGPGTNRKESMMRDEATDDGRERTVRSTGFDGFAERRRGPRASPDSATVASSTGADGAAPSLAFGSRVDIVAEDGIDAADGRPVPVEQSLEIRPWSGRGVDAAVGTFGTWPGGDVLESLEGASAAKRYRVVRELGRGGMGIVYEAWDVCLERPVAIKSLVVRGDRPVQLRRFLREAKIASRLNHPGIMAVHEFGVTDGGRAYMVMRLLRGQTLREILDSQADAADDQPRLLAAFLQACQAVAAAHDAGVIHRDLKPANIMVGEYSLVTVMDWGLAKVLDEPEQAEDRPSARSEDPLHTVCGTLFGTPGYLAPEQARGETDRIDRRSDVFALGCILCEILTGSPPFKSDCPGEAWRRAAAGNVLEALERLRRSGGPEPLVRLTSRCLAVDPDGRPADAGAVVNDLVAYLESGQRRAEQQLIRFFDLSIDLFCLASLDGYFRRVNENFHRLLGYTETELLSRRFLDFVHPDDQAGTLAEMARLSLGETTLRFRNRYLRASGEAVWLEWNARAIPEEGVIYAVARDVTEQVLLEADLEQSRRDIEDFMENANVPLHRVDGDGIIVWANRTELEFLGYRREDYIGQPIAKFHADAPVIADILARLAGGENLTGHRARLVASDGSLKTVAIHSSVYAENGVFRHTRCLSFALGEADSADDLRAGAERECAALRARVADLEAEITRRRGANVP